MTKRKYLRQIAVYKDFFKDFKKTLPIGTLRKIYQVFQFIMTLEIIPTTYLKSITGVAGLFEIRVEDDGNIYRIFCCFDEGNLVVLFNAFHKKTQKTPKNEIEKAKRIMKEYFDNKNKK
ncbi:MAG: type II toxin-antitoxin system RelE/ParE family toxin [Prevotella sp.]|nr:type II toxin-antitoxin system RelE/ParE family toxin [Prevotella sp.]